MFHSLSKELIAKAERMLAEEEIGDFLLKILYEMRKFDKAFFNFFEGKNLSLIKAGDKSFEQFIEICL